MPIQEQNIVFLESQVMSDVPEGGGAATGRVVQDGQMNNVFEDISDLDRTLGRFNLRKLNVAVRSLNTDTYLGSKLVISKLPEDADIGYTVFTTNNAFDRRADAQGRVEAYLFKGPVWPGVLYSNHIAGMKVISLIQRVNTTLPPIGKTLCLVQDEGLSGQKEQYVRITDVDVTPTIFNDGGDFERWVVRLSLSDVLRFDFIGHDPLRNDNYSYTGKTRVRDTVVADATRYFSSQRLKAPAAIGDKDVLAQNQFTNLVPAARTETALVNQFLNPELVQTLSGGTRTVQVPQSGHTRAVPVTPENRRLNWIETLTPRPAVGVLSVAYVSQGNWYTLTDQGNGTIAGSDPGFGAGTINNTTGIASITLGALPDAGSQIMWAWASPVHYTIRAGSTAINDTAAIMPIQLEDLPAIADSISFAWTAGGAAKTATVNAAGEISGHATGTIDPITGEGELRLTTLPDRGTPLTINYDWLDGEPGESVLKTLTVPFAPTINLGGALTLGTLRVRVMLGVRVYADAVSTPSGELILPAQMLRVRTTGGAVYPGIREADRVLPQTIGTVNHATGAVAITSTSVVIQGYRYSTVDPFWTLQTLSLAIDFSGDTTVTYRDDGVTTLTESTTDTLDIEALTFRLLPGQTDNAVVNSIRFVLGGLTYNDNNGDLVTGANNLVSGSVNYDTGDTTLTFWTDGAAVNPSVTSLLTRFGQWTAIDANFRAAIRPLAPESVGIIAVTEDGEQITGQADQNGDIVGDFMTGTVNYEFGVARLEFGAMGEDPENPSGPEIFIPRPVDPGTLRYNAVAFSYIPLPADIIGVDGVRLPPDGRVPIYRTGDVLAIMHPLTTAPVTPTAGVPVSLGRTRVAWVRVIDANGDTVTEDYTLDRANGTVTFSSVPEHTPVTIRHTVADLRLCIDAQINGQLTLNRELTHNFPADETLVGSCLLFGDRRARVSATWDQQSWNGTWVDTIVGNPATATLNLIDFPIQLTNEGADTDRWLLRNTGGNNWELISENRGLVWSGTYAPGGTDIAPINPRTRVWDEGSSSWVGGTPYLRIPGAANGGGWSTGNVVRINTVGAIADFWIARSIQQSEIPLDEGADCVEVYALGNVDRP